MAAESANEALTKEEKSASKPVKNREDEIREVARKFSVQPIQNHDVGVWGLLTAISTLSRKRPQGINIILSADEHFIGRCVEDSCYRIESLSVSAKHCTIYRKKPTVDEEVDSNIAVKVFLKDTSTNGTYLNWTKLHSSKARLQHGDIISFIHPPQNALAYAFVYREVSKSTGHTNGAVKRKSEYCGAESKRLKGIGIGAPEGPISLDDVRSLQRSNTGLRQQLESHVQTIETMHSENRATIARHENEMKDLKEKVSSSYLNQIKELHQALDKKQNEIDEHNMSLAELRRSIDDLKERLKLSNQSRADADEIIHSQKVTISELEAQLCEERSLRRGEREKAEAVLKSALQRAHSEAQEEIKRQAEVYLRQHNEQQEVISKLQESEKENRVLIETLRSKLEDARESLSMSDKKVRQLEVQIEDEQAAFANSRKRSETLDCEVRRLTKELESEKVAREEAWAKVSSLELEVASAVRDLSVQKQRYQGARERIILRETQLRSFYSTTEEISALFAKQQEQLKAMQKTLEDEENYTNTLLSFDQIEPMPEAGNAAHHKAGNETHPTNTAQEASGSSTQRNENHTTAESADDGSTIERHDQDENTQDLECTSSDRLMPNKEFVADIDGVGTAVAEVDPNDTERVLGTESQSGDGRAAALHKCSNLAGDTMQIDDEVQIQENMEPRMEDTENVTIKTADLLASEVAGSWAVSTAPSVHGENESPRSQGGYADGNAAEALLVCSDGQASGSQSNVQKSGIAKLSREHLALNDMIGIVAPELKQQFLGGDDGGGKNESMSDAETEDGSGSSQNDHDDNDDGTDGDSVENENEVVIEDSVG